MLMLESNIHTLMQQTSCSHLIWGCIKLPECLLSLANVILTGAPF